MRREFEAEFFSSHATRRRVPHCLSNPKARNSVQNADSESKQRWISIFRQSERGAALPSPQTPLRMGTQTRRQLAKSRPLCHSNLIFPCGFRKWFADDDDDNNNKQLQVEARCS